MDRSVFSRLFSFMSAANRSVLYIHINLCLRLSILAIFAWILNFSLLHWTKPIDNKKKEHIPTSFRTQRPTKCMQNLCRQHKYHKHIITIESFLSNWLCYVTAPADAVVVGGGSTVVIVRFHWAGTMCLDTTYLHNDECVFMYMFVGFVWTHFVDVRLTSLILLPLLLLLL